LDTLQDYVENEKYDVYSVLALEEEKNDNEN
jgi:hypothetical protein